MRVVIGIDPGSIVCGYGVVAKKGHELHYITSGDIKMSKTKPMELRLRQLFEGLRTVIRDAKPDEAAIEKVFYARGKPAAALQLGHARGVVMLSASIEDVPVFQYSALEVKKAVVGYGRADKEQVIKMTRLILDIKAELTSDSADALALALCHLNTMNIRTDLVGV
ncbi:Holliday junction resolvase [Candidatus Magnetobacterium bavaricum]|uniref:Crossover junction endodeoxyribonuclease RuvC n=1 Tax=Candidatus Magnetobacterium bavaricum TaxID=29290 RepID=A0A0F3H1P5_9BACT|nr:Holliday junction resolvase [Candidatus Magnetobacterium bavaricum]